MSVEKLRLLAESLLMHITAQLPITFRGKLTQLAQLHTTCQHSVVSELAGRKQSPSITIKGGLDVKHKENWFINFNNLLGQPSQSSTNLAKVKISGKHNISTDPFNMRELRVVTDTLGNKKAPGLDNILAILWKD